MAAFPYDVKFTLSGVAYGFMLVTPPGMTKQLNFEEVGPPEAQRVQTEATATHQDFAPQQDTVFSMLTFSGGLGQLEFDSQDDASYWWGNAVTHVDGRVYLPPPTSTLSLPSGASTIGGFTTYVHTDGVRYDFCWEGPRLHRRDASNSTNAWSTVYTANFAITDFKVFKGVGLVAIPSSTSGTEDFITLTTLAGTPVATTRNHAVYSNGTKPKFFIPNRGTCFALVDNSKVMYTVDPTQDGWLGPIEVTVGSLSGVDVGDANYPFVGGAAANDYLFTFSYSAGSNIDAEQNVTETFWQWKDKPSSENFKHIATGGDLLLFSVGPEVYYYDPGTGMSLPMRLARKSGVSVQSILGLAADNQYVYVLAQVRVPRIRTGASVALLRAHRLSGTRWSVECVWEDTNPTEAYYRLAALPYGVGTRVYWGVTSGGATSVMHMDIPADWDESTGGSFATTGVVYTSITRASFPGFGKRHLWVNVEAEDTDANNYIAVAYSIDGGSTFTSLGDTRTATKFDYTDIHSRSIVLRFTFTGSGTATPVLRVFDHHQRVRFKYLPAATIGLRIADNLELLNGTRNANDTLVTLKAALETLRTSESRIIYEDYTGNSFSCSVDAFTYRPTRHEKPTDKGELEALVLVNRADSGA